ncbi:hypothetical protein D3C72_1732810 [compost metagenome]
MSARPVAVLTSLRAASIASAPVGPQNWILALREKFAGSRSNKSRMKRSFTGVVRSSVNNGRSAFKAAPMASVTAGWLCPSASEPAPARQSMNTRPSMSST